MKRKDLYFSFFIGLIAGGISYWFNPYNDQTIFGVNLYIVMAVLTAVGSVMVTSRLSTHNYRIGLWVAIGVVSAVLLRIIFDVIFVDKTSHNLMILEITLSMLVSIPSAFLGSFIVKLAKK